MSEAESVGRMGTKWTIYYPPGDGNREQATLLLSMCGNLPVLPSNVQRELERLGPKWRAERRGS